MNEVQQINCTYCIIAWPETFQTSVKEPCMCINFHLISCIYVNNNLTASPRHQHDSLYVELLYPDFKPCSCIFVSNFGYFHCPVGKSSRVKGKKCKEISLGWERILNLQWGRLTSRVVCGVDKRIFSLPGSTSSPPGMLHISGDQCRNSQSKFPFSTDHWLIAGFCIVSRHSKLFENMAKFRCLGRRRQIEIALGEKLGAA
jgi:hypothetical protein